MKGRRPIKINEPKSAMDLRFALAIVTLLFSLLAGIFLVSIEMRSLQEMARIDQDLVGLTAKTAPVAQPWRSKCMEAYRELRRHHCLNALAILDGP